MGIFYVPDSMLGILYVSFYLIFPTKLSGWYYSVHNYSHFSDEEIEAHTGNVNLSKATQLVRCQSHNGEPNLFIESVSSSCQVLYNFRSKANK